LNSAGKYLVDGSGYDRCGPRIYEVTTDSGAYATLLDDVDPPVIKIFTKNALIANMNPRYLKLITRL